MACLERLIMDRSELDAASGEAGAMLYINMTRRTDDPAATSAYLRHVEHVQPRLKEMGFELDRKIATSPFASALDGVRYGVLLRDLRTGVEIYRPENVPLEVAQTQLDQEYAEICGAQTVEFGGQTRTLQQMARYLEDPDRSARERAWRAIADRRRLDRERIGQIYIELVSLRSRVAANAGFASFRDYAFRAKRRFDYGPSECRAFAEGIERAVTPTLRAMGEKRARSMGLASLRPWDLAVDAKGRPPLRPFESSEQMVTRTGRIFHRLDPDLAEMFDSLGSGDCLDLDSRKGKAPGGYQANRDLRRTPFIFMNAAGLQRDAETMLHEAGHAFHALLSRSEPILSYRSEGGLPLEFAEVASMSMELLTHEFWEEYYGADAEGRANAARARRVHLEQIASLLAAVAAVDSFQHWVYTTAGADLGACNASWVALDERFGQRVDWSSVEDVREHSWQRVLHLFGSPFYYIEYGIAQLGAIQLWSNFRRDRAGTLAAYKRALSLGGSRPLPELFSAAGLEFDFSPSCISQLWSEVERMLSSLPE
ncbi:MAG: M3 family oligoendopeptidase [Phycisphaerae bacterium]|nr:M3 family oligoendopeptidase [Phycisphaerae bacterium]